MTLLEKIVQSRHLTKVNAAVKRLMSGPGEANSSSMAQDVIQHYQALDETGRATFYTSLAENFNPDPKAVAQAALKVVVKRGHVVRLSWLDQTRSTIRAMPWPTPMHIVHSA